MKFFIVFPPSGVTSLAALAQPRSLAACHDKLLKPQSTCLGLLGAGDPVQYDLLVAGRADFKVPPGRLVLLELLDLGGAELTRARLLVGIHDGLLLSSAGEGLFSSFGHSPKASQALDLGDVDRTPNGAGLAWREANLVRVIVNALTHSVDPAKAERFVDRLGPGHAQTTGVDLPVSDNQFSGMA